MHNYTLTIRTHQNDFLAKMKDKVPFEGESFDEKFKVHVNGEIEITAKVPISYYDKEKDQFIQNPIWKYLKDEQKVHFERFSPDGEKEYEMDFVLADSTETRSGKQKTMDVKLVSYAIFELSKIGFTGIFNEELIIKEAEETGTVPYLNIDYWMNKLLPLTKNNYDEANNPAGWTYEIDTPNGVLYEEIDEEDPFSGNGFDEKNQPIKEQVEKQRLINKEKSNVYNIVQEISERFSVWAYFEYGYNDFGDIVSRKIIFREESPADSLVSLKYGVNQKSISRQIKREEIVSKMYIEPIENEFDDNGLMTIDRAPGNFLKENFLYNFDYFKEKGVIKDSEEFDHDFAVMSNFVRGQNIQIQRLSDSLLKERVGFFDIEKELSFKELQIDALTETIADFENLRNAFPNKGELRKEPYNPFVSTRSEFGDRFVVDLRRSVGVKATFHKPLQFWITSPNSSWIPVAFNGTENEKTISLSINQETIEVTIKLIKNQHVPSYYDFLVFDKDIEIRGLQFYFDSVGYYTEAIAKYSTMRAELTIEVGELEEKKETSENIISSLEDDISELSQDKQNKIDAFEEKYYYVIKEGNWKNSDFQLRKETKEEIVSIETELKIIPKGFGFNSGSRKINLSQIRLVKKNLNNDVIFNYVEGRDYNLLVGRLGNVFFEIIETGVSAFTYNYIQTGDTTDTSNIFALISDFSEGEEDQEFISLTYSTNMGYEEGYFEINDTNVILSTLKIIPIVAGESKEFELNKDYVYQRFLTEGRIRFQIFTSPPNFSFPQTLEVKYERDNSLPHFFSEAHEVLKTSSIPEVSYSTDYLDLFHLPNQPNQTFDFSDFKLKVGEKVPIIDEELEINIDGFVTEVEYNLNKLSDTKLVVGNYKTRFEDMFKRIAAATEKVVQRSDTYDRVSSTITLKNTFSGDILSKSILENGITLTNSARNTEVIIGDKDGTGILLRDNNVVFENAPPLIHLTGSGIFLSNSFNDNGTRKWSSAITGDGINASHITTGSLDTRAITIWDATDPRFFWNYEGLFAYAQDEGEPDEDNYVRFNGEGLLFYNNGFDALRLDWEGLEINGQDGAIKLTSELGLQVFDGQQPTPQERIQIGRLYVDGTPAGDAYGIRFYDSAGGRTLETDTNGKLWLRDSLSIGTDANNIGISGEGNTSSSVRIWAGGTRAEAPFRVQQDGTLHATQANITGTIIAAVGSIGGWTINTDRISSSGGITLKHSSTATENKIYIGTGTYNNANTSFYVDGSGRMSLKDKLTWDGASLSINGAITATSGSIGGWNISANALTSGSVSINSNTGIIAGPTITGSTVIGGTIKTSANTGNGSTAGVIIDSVSARFYNNSSNEPITRISTEDGTLFGTNVELTGKISSGNYSPNLTGWEIDNSGNAEFNNVNVRGALKSTVFTYEEINAVGGSLVVAPSGVLFEDVINVPVSGNLTIKIKKNYQGQLGFFKSGDILKAQYQEENNINSLILVVTSVDDTNIYYTQYVTTVQSNPNGLATLYTGTPFVSLGQENSGYILLKSTGENLTYGPICDIIVNNSSNQPIRKVRLGDLSELNSDVNIQNLFGNGTVSGYGLYSENTFLTGTLALPNAGITNIGSIDGSVRIWAGSSFANKDTAPFQVLQDGSIASTKGTIGGWGLNNNKISSQVGNCNIELDSSIPQISMAVQTNGTSTRRLVLGDLSNITDGELGSLSGYGLYSDNVYLKGALVAESGFISGILWVG